MRRMMLTVAVAATLALPASLVAVSVGATGAGATTTPHAVCAKMKGSETGTVVTSKCTFTPALSKTAAKAFKDLTGNSAQLAEGGTLHWTNGETTIVGAPTLTTPKAGTCPPKDTAAHAVGTVTGGTSTVTHSGNTFSVTVCIASNGKIKNAKGTAVDL
jgi:hypothetical protein